VSSATVGHTIAGHAIVLHGREIPADLVAWADRVERRYARRYCDTVGLVDGAGMHGLWKAARTYDPGRADDFRSHARWCVTGVIGDRLRKAGVKGYRYHPGDRSHRDGAPRDMGAAVLARVPDAADPVGWEVEYEDYVDGLCGQLPGRLGEVVRLVYLRCDGGSVTGAAGALGLSRSYVSELHGEAVAMLGREGGNRG
jgi:hypothetical protein